MYTYVRGPPHMRVSILDAQLSQAPCSFLNIVERSLIHIVFIPDVQSDDAIEKDPRFWYLVAHVRVSAEADWGMGLVELWDVASGGNTILVSRTNNASGSWCWFTKTAAPLQGE